MERKPMPYLCMGLSRFIGGVFFLFIGFTVFSYLNKAWQLGVEVMMDVQKIGPKGYVAIVISVIAGLIGLLIGQVIGAAIKIRSDALSEHLTIGWHYLANTTLIWLFLSGVSVSMSLGKSGTESFFYGQGRNFFTTVIIIATIGGQLISWSLYFSGTIIRSGNPLGRLLSRILPIFIGVLMGIIQSSYYGLSIIFGAIIGFILPYILIPISARLWRKDSMMRIGY